jgi:hypothetical protein
MWAQKNKKNLSPSRTLYPPPTSIYSVGCVCASLFFYSTQEKESKKKETLGGGGWVGFCHHHTNAPFRVKSRYHIEIHGGGGGTNERTVGGFVERVSWKNLEKTLVAFLLMISFWAFVVCSR